MAVDPKNIISEEKQQRLKDDDDNQKEQDLESQRKAKNCIEATDIRRISDLGLGRGVDTTDPTPWQNKTSFQVRPVTFDNIIGTEEGGLVQSYEREVSSVSELRGNASASVTNPKSAVTVGVEGEYSQSSTSRRRVVGTKVLNRTISFKDHCDDTDIKLPSGDVSFQTWLCRWILEKRSAELSTVIKDEMLERSVALKPTVQLRQLERQHTELNSLVSMLSLEECSKKVPTVKLEVNEGKSNEMTIFQMLTKHVGKDIVRYCAKFISQFHITHYVSSIQLGASGYEVVSENKAAKKFGAGGRVGVEKFATGSVGASYGKYHSKKSKDVHRIGVINLKGGIPVVERGTHDEAVVGIQIKPVSDLVKMPELRKPLQEALVEYIRNEADISSGPFKIRCFTPSSESAESTDLYLKAVADHDSGDFFLVAVPIWRASCSYFYLKPCTNSDKHPHEFYICYYDTKDETKTVPSEEKQFESESDDEYYEPISFYLQTPVSLFGTNDCRLHLKVHSKEKDCRLILESSIVKHNQPPVSVSSWMRGKEMCFIKCARRRSRSAYLAVSQLVVSAEKYCDAFAVQCVNSRENATLFQIVHGDVTQLKNKDKGADPHRFYSKQVLSKKVLFPTAAEPTTSNSAELNTSESNQSITTTV